jgi:hypothetical protein
LKACCGSVREEFNPVFPPEDDAKTLLYSTNVVAAYRRVSVRRTKRDLLFVVGRLAGLLEENRLAVIARQRCIKKGERQRFH